MFVSNFKVEELKNEIIALPGYYLMLVEEQIYWVDCVAFSSDFFTIAYGKKVTVYIPKEGLSYYDI